MPHVPRPGHSRRTHGRVPRKSHDHSGYLAPLLGADGLVDQTVIDGVVGPGAIPPGTLDGDGVLVPGSVSLTPFADTVRPVGIVSSLPTLPDVNYPVGSTVVLTSDGKLYRNDAGAWSKAVDGLDLVADTVTAAAIAAGAVSTTELAAKAVTAEKLQIGGGRYLTNPDFETGSFAGWSFGSAGGGGSMSVGNDPGWRSQGVFYGDLESGSVGYAELSQIVVGFRYGDRIQLSALMANSVGGRLAVEWLEADGTPISSEFSGFLNNPDTGGYGGTGPQRKTFLFAAAPADTAAARIILVNQSVSTHLLVDDVWLSRVGDLINPDGSVQIDSTGILIRNGKLTFEDSFGETALTGAGFGDTWQRFLQSGFFNGDFVALPPSSGSDIDNASNPLPHWPFTKASGTAITARSVSDTGAGSQRALQFTMAAGASNDKSYVEQIYPLISTNNRAYTFSPYAYMQSSAGSVDAEAFMEWQFLKRDGSTTGSSYTAFLATNVINAVGGAELGPGTGEVHPPGDAYFLRVRYGLRRKSGGSTSATSTMQFNDVAMLMGSPRTHIPEVSDPTSWSRATILQTSGTLLLAPDSLGMNPTGRKAVALGSDTSLSFGASAPPNDPSDGDLWYDNSTGMWFAWFFATGQWLCTCPHSAIIFNTILPSASHAATVASNIAGGVPKVQGSDIWVESVNARFFVNGGTALSGSHKWVGVVNKRPTGNTDTAVATINIDSGSSSVWREITVAVGALLNNGTAHFAWALAWTKTGTPGNLFNSVELIYRHVAA